MGFRFIVVLMTLLFLPFVSSAGPARADSCQFVLGFLTLHDMIPDTVGNCLVDEHHNADNGDGLQETTGPVGGSGTGLLVWRKADNWTAYTDGYHTWLNGPNGLQERLNTACFSWEAGCKPTSLSDLPVMLPVASTNIAAVFNTLRPTDTAIYFFNAFFTPTTLASVNATLTQGQIAYAYGSWSDMQSALPSIPSQSGTIIYNPEHHPATPIGEQQDLVSTVAAASAGIHNSGRKFALVPDAAFTQQYAAQLAPYADLYLIQAQKYQGNLAQFDNFVARATQQIKSANPACAVWVHIQVSTVLGPTAVFGPARAYAALQSLPSLPDGIVIWTFPRQDVATQQFVALLRPNG